MTTSSQCWVVAVSFLIFSPALLMARCVPVQIKHNDDVAAIAKKVEYAKAVISDSTYLSQDKPCVAASIQFLGVNRVTSSIPRLAQLLGYQARDAVYAPNLFKQYPAIAALASMGESAVPNLIAVIQDNEPSSIESKNAVMALMNIPTYRDHPGRVLTVLANAAETQNDATRVARLHKAAEDARTNWCATVPCAN